MNPEAIPIAVVRLGRVVSTANALNALTQEDILRGIQRHQAGDWGELDSADREENNRSPTQGERLLSVYRSSAGVKFYIITEADRSITTVLLPEDY